MISDNKNDQNDFKFTIILPKNVDMTQVSIKIEKGSEQMSIDLKEYNNLKKSKEELNNVLKQINILKFILNYCIENETCLILVRNKFCQIVYPFDVKLIEKFEFILDHKLSDENEIITCSDDQTGLASGSTKVYKHYFEKKELTFNGKKEEYFFETLKDISYEKDALTDFNSANTAITKRIKF